MNLASWILFGVIVGITANNIDSFHKSQILGWIGVSVLGTVIGGMIGSIIFGIRLSDSFNFPIFILAALTSVLLLVVMESELLKEKTNQFIKSSERLAYISHFLHRLEKNLHKRAFKYI